MAQLNYWPSVVHRAVYRLWIGQRDGTLLSEILYSDWSVVTFRGMCTYWITNILNQYFASKYLYSGIYRTTSQLMFQINEHLLGDPGPVITTWLDVHYPLCIK